MLYVIHFYLTKVWLKKTNGPGDLSLFLHERHFTTLLILEGKGRVAVCCSMSTSFSFKVAFFCFPTITSTTWVQLLCWCKNSILDQKNNSQRVRDVTAFQAINVDTFQQTILFRIQFIHQYAFSLKKKKKKFPNGIKRH